MENEKWGLDHDRVGREGREGKASTPSVLGWEEGIGSSTMRAMTGRSSSEDSPVRVLAVL